jgi:hypothetical protein
MPTRAIRYRTVEKILNRSHLRHHLRLVARNKTTSSIATTIITIIVKRSIPVTHPLADNITCSDPQFNTISCHLYDV